MTEVRLRPVTYAELSGLRHEVSVADGPPHRPPELLVIRYSGSYRVGAEGQPDARYILAAAAAAREAWWAYSTILDFRELEYRWGDEMQWVAGIGWDPGVGLHWPLAIVVGDHCREALRSLLRDEYPALCVESLEEAFALCRRKAEDRERQMREKRAVVRARRESR